MKHIAENKLHRPIEYRMRGHMTLGGSLWSRIVDAFKNEARGMFILHLRVSEGIDIGGLALLKMNERKLPQRNPKTGKFMKGENRGTGKATR